MGSELWELFFAGGIGQGQAQPGRRILRWSWARGEIARRKLRRMQSAPGHAGHALAEAEVEYEDIVSTQIDVGFEIDHAPEADILVGVTAVIWTTTPWTLPSNMYAAKMRSRRTVSGVSWYHAWYACSNTSNSVFWRISALHSTIWLSSSVAARCSLKKASSIHTCHPRPLSGACRTR